MVGLKVGPIFYRIGTGSFLHCFFSTIAVRLEAGNWGSKYPILMNQLYKGEVSAGEIGPLIGELDNIKSELKKHDIGQVVWDIEDRSKKPPWGDNVAARITDLSNYFVTNDGKDLFEVFYAATDACQRVNRNLTIKSL